MNRAQSPSLEPDVPLSNLAPTTPAPTTISSGTALQSHRCAVEVGKGALYRRVPHGVGDLIMDVRVEGVRDEVGLRSKPGEGFGSGQLHLHVDLSGSGQECSAEDAGISQDVVHACPVCGERGPSLERCFGLYLWVGVG